MNHKFALIVLLNKLGICKAKFEYTYSYRSGTIFTLGQLDPIEIVDHDFDVVIKKCK